jgi:hypothetical protein
MGQQETSVVPKPWGLLQQQSWQTQLLGRVPLGWQGLGGRQIGAAAVEVAALCITAGSRLAPAAAAAAGRLMTQRLTAATTVVAQAGQLGKALLLPVVLLLGWEVGRVQGREQVQEQRG